MDICSRIEDRVLKTAHINITPREDSADPLTQTLPNAGTVLGSPDSPRMRGVGNFYSIHDNCQACRSQMLEQMPRQGLGDLSSRETNSFVLGMRL